MSTSRPAKVLEIACDVLVAGGGLGGVAAAMRAALMGRQVCMIEETGWPGGQISTQGVSALDEHRYIETFGGTASYYELRKAIRAYYREGYMLATAAQRAVALNPGNAWVSRLSFEPRAGVAALDAMMAGSHDSGALQVFYHTRPVAAEVYDGRVASVLTRHVESGALLRFRAEFVLDATDLGDLLPLTATAYAVGAESRAQTGEPSAPNDADRSCTQHLTFPFAVEFCPGETHTIPKPEGYDENRVNQPFSLVYAPWDPAAPAYRMFKQAPGTYGAFWTYRRALDAGNFTDARVPRDVSIINWSANDFRGGSPVDRLPDERAALYRQARLLSLGFLYWLQTEAPRDDGGTGYPELRPRPDVMGSVDGLSQMPYIREGRRIRALTMIYEQDIAAANQQGARAAHNEDSVGIGFYPIDLHGCGTRTLGIATRPFQISLGALVSTHTANLLAAAKNIGTTHLTNGAYRLHPIEWAIGEAAATLAVFCLKTGATPRDVHARPALVRALQALLLDQGIPLYWYTDVPLQHPAFAAAQLLAVTGVWPGDEDSLEFRPDDLLTLGEAKRHLSAAADRIRAWGGVADPDAGALAGAPEDATLPLRWDAADAMINDALPWAPQPTVARPGERMTRADLAVRLNEILRAAIEAGGR